MTVALRPARFEDVEAAAAVACALDEAILGFAEPYVDELRREWKALDLERDAWVAEVDGRIAGYASVEKRGQEELVADGYVHPDFWARGIGAALVEATEARALEQGAALIRNPVLEKDARARALLESLGYAYVRGYWRMLVELQEPPPSPDWDAGLVVSPVVPDEPELRAFHAALEDAFAEEWGHEPESFEAWRARRVEGRPFDPTLWFVVHDGDEIAATLVCDWKRSGGGWIAGIGVRKPWRRRGIGLALLRQAFGEFYRRGERTVALAVDAQNPTGATRLYERAGMHVSWSAAFYEKTLAS